MTFLILLCKFEENLSTKVALATNGLRISRPFFARRRPCVFFVCVIDASAIFIYTSCMRFSVSTFLPFHISWKGTKARKVGRGKKRENEKDNGGDRMNYKWRRKEMNMGLEEYTKGRWEGSFLFSNLFSLDSPPSTLFSLVPLPFTISHPLFLHPLFLHPLFLFDHN